MLLGGEMHPVINAQLKSFSETNNLTHEKRDTQFENYSIFSVLSGFLGEDVDAYNVHLKGNEFGVDGIGIVIQGELVTNTTEVLDLLERVKNPSVHFIFFQSKTSTNFDYGDISKFYDSILDFFNDDLSSESSQVEELTKVMKIIYEKAVGRKNPQLSCFYITTGNYTSASQIEKLRNNFVEDLKNLNIFDNTSILAELVGNRELQRWFRAATSSFEAEIEYPRNVVMPINQNVVEAYIGYINARNLLKLYTQSDESGGVVGINKAVFYDNIRDYDPKSKINKGIKKGVLESGGAEFVFRNNGITVVAKTIDRTADKFRLEDFQIVNGCQTSNIIYDLIYGDDRINDESSEVLLDQIQVPFRLIGSKDDDFVSSIIIGTNRQNPVKDDQFWALRPFMKNFEEYCKSLESEEIIYFERRDNQYRATNEERTRIMQPSVLMKAVAACFLFQPQRAARDYRGILSEYENAIFLDDHDVRIYHAAAYLYYRLEFLWRNNRLSNDYKTFRYYILAGIGLILTENSNIFKMRKSSVTAVVDAFLALAKDEEKLKSKIEYIMGIINSRLDEMSVSTQERIRDSIRSESFSTNFKEKITVK